MRLDKFLKVSRIIKRRTLSKEISESSRVKVSDEIEIEFGRSLLTIKVKELREHVLKEDSAMLYEIIKEERIDRNNKAADK